MSQATRLSPIRIKNCAERGLVHRSGTSGRQREGLYQPQIGIDTASVGKRRARRSQGNYDALVSRPPR